MSTASRKSKVLIVARDAGAASALAPVARILISDDRASAVVIGFGHAEPVFLQHELPLWAVDDENENPSVAKQVLEDERPQFVLTGTSMKAKLDDGFWSHAREMGVPTAALLDHWSHYWERFSDEDGQARYAYLPDTIAVMDQSACDTMIKAGCPPERITITGQPAFDEFVTISFQSQRQLRTVARRELDVSEDDALLLFASEPQAKHYGANANSPTFLGYAEDDSLRLLWDSLRAAREKLPRPVQVIAKLHPLETHERLSRTIPKKPDLKVRILQHFSPLRLIAAADVVTGMTSVFLLQAALTGKRTISIQPGRRRPDEFIDHLGGIVDRADNAEACQRKLVEGMNESTTVRQQRRRQAMERGFDGHAGRRVADLIYKRLGLESGSNQRRAR